MEARETRFIRLHVTRGDKEKPLFMDNHITTTKYNVLTFLPKNLFFQFSRLANFYFLVVISLLQFKWAPISAVAAMVPLIIVIGITAVREAIEDYLRYKSDQKVNNSSTRCLGSENFNKANWKDILVGDIIFIRQNEQVPADVVLLSTSHEEGIAYIETANLDGESNLKQRQSLSLTAGISTVAQLNEFQADIMCDPPNNVLYTFNGNLSHDNKQYSLDNKQILLRGCTLRNTQWAIGAVVYTGHETKIMKNSNKSRTKRSRLEHGLNRKLISVFVLILVFGLINASLGYIFEKEQIDSSDHWYFFRNEKNKRSLVSTFFILFVSNIVVINTMVPISLYVTLEVVRIIQCLFTAWDDEMFDPELKQHCNVRTTNITDDLGQIEYIFSDKTGTLTCNVMEFMKCSVNGKSYGKGITEVEISEAKRSGRRLQTFDRRGRAFKDDSFYRELKDPSPELSHFLWLLSLCNAVISEPDETKPFGYQFQAASPDEGALVDQAAEFGYILAHRTPHSVIIKFNGTEYEVSILANLEFTSERKRSSVIVRHPITNQIILYCKGADDLIYERLSPESLNKEVTRVHLKQFAASGLRTLCCAYKVIDEQFYTEWAERYHEATCRINDRDAAIDLVANEMESNLTLLGATAIEDKLQDDVSDTISSLLKANINVWVITGDKRETAINIGYATALLTNETKVVLIDSEDEAEVVQLLNDAILANESVPLALVASGTSLSILMNDKNVDKFTELVLRCQSVICCRVSPLQKASIVALIRKKTKKIALAIGDGANDVGMILEADVGIGISGKEGRQAVLSSDYAITQFKYLKRLLLVHGRLNFYRNVDLIYYSFYKNMTFSLCNFIYGMFSSNNGGTMFDSYLYMIYNIVFTSIPPIVFATFDQDVSIQSMMRIPQLYCMDGKRKWYQSSLRFWCDQLLGIFHCLITFFIVRIGMKPYVYSNGFVIGEKEYGTTVYFAIITIVNLRIAFICRHWTWIHHLSIWLSILIFPISILLIDFSHFSPDFVGTTTPILKCHLFYLAVIACVIVATLPVIGIYAVQEGMNSTLNNVRYMEGKKRAAKMRKLREKISMLGK